MQKTIESGNIFKPGMVWICKICGHNFTAHSLEQLEKGCPKKDEHK